MKRQVQILLLIVFAGALFAAEEETMEERKQRIRRKYLRQRADITYSTEEVPGTSATDEEVADSERFLEPQSALESEEPGAVMPPPPIRRPPPQTVNRNWLLDAGETEDPYTDSFGQQDEEKAPTQKDWNMWGAETEPSPYSGTLQESRFSRSVLDTSAGQSLDQGGTMSRGGGFSSRSAYVVESQPGSQPSGTIGSQEPEKRSSYNPFYNPDQSRYGQKTETQPGSPLYGSSPQTAGDRYTPYKNPLQQQQEQQPWSGGYTPYKSPYQTQREQRQEKWGGNTYNPSQQEFQRQNSYQQWKQRNPAPINPMSDDAYIQEVMPQSRR